ncbi:MAG: SMP-30/gluconolactonase/LRE family protein, partial [Burkholderiales bacterium]
RVARFAPDGRLDRTLELPVQCPTSCQFGGPDLSSLFVTTARQRLTPEELAKQPLAGALLMLDTGLRGLPEPRFVG